MKAEIHPEYVLAHVTCSCGNEFMTRSTKPELHVEVCSHCHPFYTGKQKLMDAGGRVERFQRRLEKAGGHPPLDTRLGVEMSVSYGGQAVLEGVMMRGPSVWSVAVRTPAGEVVEVTKSVSSPMQRHRIWRLPVIRGVIALGESLAIGFRALAISANYAMQEEREEGADGEPAEVSTEISRGQIIFSFVIAIGFALMLFKVGPALLTSWLPIDGTYSFVVVEGLIRVAVFILYIVLIGLLPDLKRVFQYHGAEHKAINALEGGSELTPEKVQKFSLIHPRCGTAFLLWVMVIGIFVFAFVGRPVWYWLVISRILLLPVIAGLAYELIRYAGKHQGNRVLMTLLAPGLWLQRLTTREPSLDQIEVSIRALQEVMRIEQAESDDELRAESRVEVMA